MISKPSSLFGSLLFLSCVMSAQETKPQAPQPAAATRPGDGDLRILPTRVVMEGKDRSAEVMLQNEGNARATYRIFFKEMEMTPKGKLIERTKAANELTAADVVRYAPRQVELAPGEAQNVRIQLRKPAGLADGEYRSHMVIQTVPPAEPPRPVGQDDNAPNGLSFQIRPIYGISIPVIVRHGQCQAQVQLSGLRYGKSIDGDAIPVLTLQLDRTGNRSVLGDFQVSVDSGGSLKKGTVLYDYRGVAVYPNIPAREIEMPLAQGKNGGLKGTRIKVTFTPLDIKRDQVAAFLDLAE